MRILILQPLETFATKDLGDGFYNAFKALGHDVHIFRTGEFLQAQQILVNSFEQKTNTRIEVPYMDLALNGFFDTVVMEDIEMVFVIRGLIPNKEYLDKLKKLGVMRVLYSTEDPYDYKTTKDIAENYDFIFSNDQSGPVLYKNCNWIPVAGCNETFYPIPDIIKHYDLSFIGTFFRERVNLFTDSLELLKSLKTYFAGFWVHSKGKDEQGGSFGEFGSDETPFFKLLNLQGVTEPEKVNIFYNATKIVPNPQRNKEWTGNIHLMEARNLSPRVFECALSNTFQLVSSTRKSTLKKFFEDDEIITFTDSNDFQDKVKYYLTHEDERIKIAEKTRNKVLHNHTYKNRVEELLQYLS